MKEKEEIFKDWKHYKALFILIIAVILTVAFPELMAYTLIGGVCLALGFFLGFTVGKDL